METIIIKVDNKKNTSFLLKLLRRLNFVADIQHNTNPTNDSITKQPSAPIEWAESTPDFSDFTGIWKGREVTLNQLREKAWKRN
jgi:hypothetical protein